MAAKTTWVITSSGERPLGELRQALEAAGLQVDEVLDAIGVITGRSAKSRVAAIRRVAGVADVSASRGVDVGPPGSVDTW